MRLANGFGSIVYLGKNRRKPYGARVTVGWTDEGKQKFKYIGYFEKRTEAFAGLVEYNQKPFDIDARKMTFEEVFNAWSERHFEKVSNGSKLVYKSAFKKCEKLFKIPFTEIKTSHLQSVVDEYKDTASVRVVKVIASLLFEYAIKHDIVEKDYAQFIELPQQEKKRPKSPFTLEEIQLLWNHKENVHVEMLLILLYSGMRISELLGMKIENINLNERYMIGGVKTKAGINRVIPIHKDIMPFIEKQVATNKTFLFETDRGNKHHYSNLGTKINGTIRSFNFDHTIHDTRHTFISQADRLGIDQILIKRIVGHATKDITEHYTHKLKDDLIKAIDDFYYFD